MIARFIARQLRKPTGLVGRFVGAGLARGNAYEAHWTVALLNLQPTSHVLELGFGPGVAVQDAAAKTPLGRVAGVDFSDAMVRLARRRNRAAVDAGRVDLQRGDASALPFADASFDAVYAIHLIYFWSQPNACLQEARRVLKPDGALAVTIMPRDNWPVERTPPADIFTLYSGDEVAQLLQDAGFHDMRVEASPHPDQFPGVCVLGVT